MKSSSSIYYRYFTYIKPVIKLPIIKNYGSTIFTLLTISILTLFAIKPTVETILVLQKKLADEEQTLQKITQKSNDLSLAKKNYDNLDESIKSKIATAVPNATSLKSIISALEQTAKMHEASISALQIQPLVIDNKTKDGIGSLAEISFIFNIESNYQNLIALLQDLRASGRLISVDSLSLSKNVDGTAIIMSLSGKTYYLK
ncbi:type 4a pilus biogenesis protein PilO [Patescibacteria group bacterium]|nr:type 4a pilus biogenesis protein PilO [Patescibacteria group bacterium]